MKQIFKTVLFALLISITATGCMTLSIPEQKEPSLSLMALKINVPKDFIVMNSGIKSNGETYARTLMSEITTSDKKNPQIFVNIPAGKYRLNDLYAKTCHACNRYRELDLKFNDTDKRTIQNNEWIELKAGSVKYAGLLEFITIDQKDGRLAEIGTIFKKTPQEVNKAIINESEVTYSKGKTNCIIIRLDHPALIGEVDSLKIEKDVWVSLINDKKENSEVKWGQILKNRIAEIDKEISRLSKVSKK